MPADWELDDEVERIEEENRWEDARLAAKLVVNGYDRQSAVETIKSVNTNREGYKNDPGVYIEGDEDQPDEWTIDECNYPKEIKGNFNPRQIDKIANELLEEFDN
ncbi:hypothetical protein [Serratia fonticola]|uniref:hypothetical protein n=1 Tax=Serratia fonticola TaxID=47917 RepID=UPI002178D72F|nr:hypothetical protein [Serratia fonticola]CAI1876878.1 Uncharacterised protein [Serratia fonticola]